VDPLLHSAFRAPARTWRFCRWAWTDEAEIPLFLAAAFGATDSCAEAESLLSRALSIRERVLAPAYPDFAESAQGARGSSFGETALKAIDCGKGPKGRGPLRGRATRRPLLPGKLSFL
jgi:hypothetical protein